MKERDEIADLFKDQLEHHIEPVDANIWTQVQTGLASKSIGGAATTSKLVGIIKIAAVTSVLVGTSIGIGYWLQSPKKESLTTSGQTQNQEAQAVETIPESPTEATVTNTIGTGLTAPSNSNVSAPIPSNIQKEVAKDQNVNVSGDETPDNQAKQDLKNLAPINEEIAVMGNSKNVDSKSLNNNQSAVDAPKNTLEKNHNNLLLSDIPNIFTPNGDGKNDLFSIPVAENVAHTTKVFSQKGELMVEFTQVSSGWDGTKSGGSEAANGTYFYVTFVSDQSGNQKQIKGTINLIR